MDRLRVFLVLALFSLTACNGVRFSTNAGEFVTQSAKSTLVVEYTKAEIMKYNADSLGLIEVSECQPKHGDLPVSRQTIVKTMKLHVLDRGGNGLVIEDCGTEPTAECNEFLSCWGMAYAVPQKQSRP